jgi:hypothetical protein
MDHQRFDEFVRFLGHGRSRRDVFRILAGGLAAGLLGMAGRNRAAAQTCGVLGDACTDNTDCCTGLTCFEAVCGNPSGLCMDEGEFCGAEGLECCEGLSCTDDYCASAATCGVLGDACTSNADCCTGLTCFEALCDNPSGLCKNEGEFCGSEGLECCSGLACTNDYCASATLPNTGSGGTADRGISSSLLGAGVAAGAAALLAGKRLRAQEVPDVDDRT